MVKKMWLYINNSVIFGVSIMLAIDKKDGTCYTNHARKIKIKRFYL